MVWNRRIKTQSRTSNEIISMVQIFELWHVMFTEFMLIFKTTFPSTHQYVAITMNHLITHVQFYCILPSSSSSYHFLSTLLYERCLAFALMIKIEFINYL